MSGVGWVFTPRLPVRGAKSPRAVKKLSVALPGGAKPAIGATLTPVKRAAKAATAAKAPAKAAKKASPAKAAKKAGAAKTQKAAKAPAKAAKKAAAAKTQKAAKAPAKAAKKATAAVAAAPAALKRDRQPVNPEAQFTEFRSSHRVGSRVEGEVTAFTSHGAVITVATRTGRVECYAPTAMLGDPAPARARDVLKRGDRRTFKLVTVDAERRIAELALT